MILTRRNFFKAILPAAAGGLVLAEELLHPGRVFFLPPQNLTIYGGYQDLHFRNSDIERIIRKTLAKDVAKVMDEIAWQQWNGPSGLITLGIPKSWSVAA